LESDVLQERIDAELIAARLFQGEKGMGVLGYALASVDGCPYLAAIFLVVLDSCPGALISRRFKQPAALSVSPNPSRES
jgi:hypothetical protein